ncbi:hypothetical protein Tco_0504885, partial [Tanacetum coccineum]
TPPKKARKFKKPASPQLTTVPISLEEPTGKSKRVKRPAKKSTKASARGVVIRETPEMPLSKKKEKVDVARGKGIKLLSDVALTEEAHSAKIKPSVTNEGTGVKPGVLDVTEEESFENEAESWGNDEDETKTTNKVEGDEDEEMDYTTSQLYDDVDIRLNEPVDTDKGFIQEDVPSQQTPILLTVPVSVITDSSPVLSTVILQTLPYFTLPPQQSISTPPPTTEATNPQSALPDFASVF